MERKIILTVHLVAVRHQVQMVLVRASLEHSLKTKSLHQAEHQVKIASNKLLRELVVKSVRQLLNTVNMYLMLDGSQEQPRLL